MRKNLSESILQNIQESEDFDTFCDKNHELIDNTYNEVMSNAKNIPIEEFIAKDEPVDFQEWEMIARDLYDDSKINESKNLNESNGRYYILKKLDNVLEKLDNIDYGDIEGTERHGNIEPGLKDQDKVLNELKKLVKEYNITKEEFNEVFEPYSNAFGGLSYDDVAEGIENISEEEPKEEVRDNSYRTSRISPYERTKASVYATGNKWAIENWNATHN